MGTIVLFSMTTLYVQSKAMSMVVVKEWPMKLAATAVVF